MTSLVVGASGATGKLLVGQLLNMGQNVRVIVRSSSNIPDSWINNDKVSIIKAHISDLSLEEMSNYTKDCQGFSLVLVTT